MATTDEAFDITVKQGVTFTEVFSWQEDNGTPISLAGYEAHMQIRNKPGGQTLYADLSSPSDGIELEPNDPDTSEPLTGEIHVRIPAATTAGIPRTCFYDLILASTSDPSEIVGISYGKVVLIRRVTVWPSVV